MHLVGVHVADVQLVGGVSDLSAASQTLNNAPPLTANYERCAECAHQPSTRSCLEPAFSGVDHF
jgi:hypothetical protein